MKKRNEPAETIIIRSIESDRTRAAAFSHNQDPLRMFAGRSANIALAARTLSMAGWILSHGSTAQVVTMHPEFSVPQAASLTGVVAGR
jgi:hypothetical protein